MMSGFVYFAGVTSVQNQSIVLSFNLDLLDSDNQGSPINQVDFAVTVNQGDTSADVNGVIVDSAIARAADFSYTLHKKDVLMIPYTGSL